MSSALSHLSSPTSPQDCDRKPDIRMWRHWSKAAIEVERSGCHANGNVFWARRDNCCQITITSMHSHRYINSVSKNTQLVLLASVTVSLRGRQSSARGQCCRWAASLWQVISASCRIVCPWSPGDLSGSVICEHPCRTVPIRHQDSVALFSYITVVISPGGWEVPRACAFCREKVIITTSWRLSATLGVEMWGLHRCQ